MPIPGSWCVGGTAQPQGWEDTVPTGGTNCPTGPPVPSGMGVPGAGVHLVLCWGVWGLHRAGVSRYSPCLPQAAPSQGNMGGQGPGSHSGSGAGARSVLSRVSHGNGDGLCPGDTSATGPRLSTRGRHLPSTGSAPERGLVPKPTVPVRWFVSRGVEGVPSSPGVIGAPHRCQQGWNSPSQPVPMPPGFPAVPRLTPSFASLSCTSCPQAGPHRGSVPLPPPSLPTAPGCGRGGDRYGDRGCVHLGLSQVSRAGPHPPVMRPWWGCHCTGGFMAVGRTLVTTWAGARAAGGTAAIGCGL